MTDAERDRESAGQVGSWRHMIILCAILLGIAAAGYAAMGKAGAAPDGVGPGGPGAALYLPLLAAEWGLFYYVRIGVHTRGARLRDLISARPLRARTLAADLLLGLLLFAAWLGLSWLLDRALGAGNQAAIRPLVIHRASELPLWTLLALSAGFVEELTFRGYLQRQFGALLRSPWLGAAAQAILFGVTHGYQGGVLMLKIAAFGLMFGIFALLRRSLVPGMAAHAGVDLMAGLVALR